MADEETPKKNISEQVTPLTLLKFIDKTMELTNAIGAAVVNRHETGDTDALNSIEMQTYGFLFDVAELFEMNMEDTLWGDE